MEGYDSEDISNQNSLTYSDSMIQSDILFRSLNIQIKITDLTIVNPKRTPYPINIVNLEIE
jgi:hypothetical protein